MVRKPYVMVGQNVIDPNRWTALIGDRSHGSHWSAGRTAAKAVMFAWNDRTEHAARGAALRAAGHR